MSDGASKDLWAAYPERRGRRGKRWLAVWIDPTGRERSRAFAKKAEAEQYASKMEIDVARGAYIDPQKARITVAEWCETWMDGYAAHRVSTVRQAQVHIGRIVAEFGLYPLGSLRPSQIRSWIARLQEEGLEDSYIYALHGATELSAHVAKYGRHESLLTCRNGRPLSPWAVSGQYGQPVRRLTACLRASATTTCGTISRVFNCQTSKYSSNSCGCGRSRIGSSSLDRL